MSLKLKLIFNEHTAATLYLLVENVTRAVISIQLDLLQPLGFLFTFVFSFQVQVDAHQIHSGLNSGTGVLDGNCIELLKMNDPLVNSTVPQIHLLFVGVFLTVVINDMIIFPTPETIFRIN